LIGENKNEVVTSQFTHAPVTHKTHLIGHYVA